MRYVGIVCAFALTPFIALFWALVVFYTGWVGGWKIVADELRK